MASSKKYGYQLRGEKLSLVELDVTGSGNGLNYTYDETVGLDITTDPSAWKSPLETITDGLQIEYLSNEFILYDEIENEINSSLIEDSIPSNNSTMDNINWIHTLNDDMLALVEASELGYPITLSQFEAAGFTGTATNVLKVIKTKSTTASNELGSPGFYIDLLNLTIGNMYTFSVNFKFNCAISSGDVITQPYTMDLKVFYEPYQLQDVSLHPIEELYIFNKVNIAHDGNIFHPDSSSIDSFNTGWATCSFDFRATNEEMGFFFITPNMNGTTDDDFHILLDNMKVHTTGLTQPDLSKAKINLPSYAQKALLDYVRAQEAYEGGDLQKWDFFMKQFRSKLERWEDSRITGPRVLGPSSSAIR